MAEEQRQLRLTGRRAETLEEDTRRDPSRKWKTAAAVPASPARYARQPLPVGFQAPKSADLRGAENELAQGREESEESKE